MRNSPAQKYIPALQRPVAPVTPEERERALARAAEVGAARADRRPADWACNRRPVPDALFLPVNVWGLSESFSAQQPPLGRVLPGAKQAIRIPGGWPARVTNV